MITDLVCARPTRAYPEGRTGTDAGYQAHWKAGDSACEECRAAAVKRSSFMRQKHGRYPTTPEQNRVANLKEKFGLTVEQYEKLLADQDGGCAVCGSEVPGGRWGGNFHIDHDHECCPGKKSCGRCIRGLLCAPCNVGLGAFRDDPDRLLSAMAYLLQKELPS